MGCLELCLYGIKKQESQDLTDGVFHCLTDRVVLEPHPLVLALPENILENKRKIFGESADLSTTTNSATRSEPPTLRVDQ